MHPSCSLALLDCLYIKLCNAYCIRLLLGKHNLSELFPLDLQQTPINTQQKQQEHQRTDKNPIKSLKQEVFPTSLLALSSTVGIILYTINCSRESFKLKSKV